MISLFWTLVTTLFFLPALLEPPPAKVGQAFKALSASASIFLISAGAPPDAIVAE